MYIGNIYLPAVESFNLDDVARKNEAIGGLGVRGYSMAEYESDLPGAELSGYLLKKYNTTRTLNQIVEDAQSIRQRSGAYNYIYNVNGRTGWMFCNRANIPYSSGALRDFTMSGLWLDHGMYTTQQHCRPVTRANDWSIVGENWVAIPIGASYSGGDGSTDTVSSEDGTMTLVLADSNNVNFDLAAVEYDVGECRVYDGTTQVYNSEHVFSGNCVISNGLYKVTLSSNTVTLHYWNGSAYTKIDDFSAGSFSRVSLISVTSDEIKCKTDNAIEITVERGRIPLIDTPVDLTCTALTPANQSTSGDNYLTLGTNLYVCSDRNFSIASNVIDSGNLWIFYAASGVQATAHNALVKSNLKRNIVER